MRLKNEKGLKHDNVEIAATAAESECESGSASDAAVRAKIQSEPAAVQTTAALSQTLSTASKAALGFRQRHQNQPPSSLLAGAAGPCGQAAKASARMAARADKGSALVGIAREHQSLRSAAALCKVAGYPGRPGVTARRLAAEGRVKDVVLATEADVREPTLKQKTAAARSALSCPNGLRGATGPAVNASLRQVEKSVVVAVYSLASRSPLPPVQDQRWTRRRRVAATFVWVHCGANGVAARSAADKA